MTDNPYTIAYSEKSYEDLFLTLLTDAYNQNIITDDTNFESYLSAYEDLENSLIIYYSVYAYLLSEIYVDLTRIYKSRNLWEASDTDLDIFGSMFLPRREESYSVTEVTYSCTDPATENIIIPVGSVVATSGENVLSFQTLAEAILPNGETEVTIGVQCLVSGLLGNIGAGEIDTIVSRISGIDDVTNEVKATGGRERENTISYRERLLNWKYTLAKGTYDSIVNAITDISSVDGYFIERYWDGYGSTKIVIDPPLQTVVDMVVASLDAVKAVDEDYYVVPVSLITVNVTMVLNITLDEIIEIPQSKRNEIESIAEGLVQVYIDGGYNLDGTEREALGIGNDFVPFKCGMYLSSQIPEIKDITFTAPSSPVTIQSHEKAQVGSVNISIV